MKHSIQIAYAIKNIFNGKAPLSQLNIAEIYKINMQNKNAFIKKIISPLLPLLFFINGFAQQNLALDFDGINDVASIPHYDAIHFSAFENFSIECWVKIPAADQVNSTYRYNTILQKGSGSYPYSLGIFNQKAAPSYQRGMVYAYRSDGANVSLCISKKRIDDNQFHHLAFVRNAGTLYLYIDGLLDNTGYDIAGSSVNYGDLYIGNDASAAHANLSGLIDEIRIWKIPLTASQIQYHMNCKLTGTETGLVGYYNFDNPSAVAGGNNAGVTYIADNLGNNHTGALNNFSLSEESSNWVNGNAAFNPTFPIYLDADGDTYGSATSYIEVNSCTVWPAGYVTNNTDCNDTDPNIYPNATELCNGFDDNCNGQIDEGFEKTTYYADSDGDTYGDAGVPMQVCSKPDGYVTDNTDCNDANASIHPGAPEICGNGIDDDCDGLIDEECITFDHDGDGYTFKDGDCNDADANIHPGATEICGNGIDDNCNGQLDEGCDLPGISIDDSRVVEGSMNVITTMTFTVSLSRPSADTIWVMARSADSTARAISDYKPDKGIIRFLPGVTTKKIKGLIYGDMIAEKNEKLKVILYNPVNAVITDSIGVGTIVDNDIRITAVKKTDENTSASNSVTIEDGTIKVFPNPARDILNIQIGQPFKNNAAIQLVNLAGSVVKRFSLALSLKQSVHQLNIAGLSAGVYMLVVQDNSGNKTTQKIIINH